MERRSSARECELRSARGSKCESLVCLHISWWWFRKADVEFYEKLSPELREKGSILTPYWKLPRDVQERWSISAYKLEELVRDKGLPAYHLDSDKGIILADEAYLARSPWLGGEPRLNSCMFNVCDLQVFEILDREKPKRKRSLDLDDLDLDRLAIHDFGGAISA